MICHFVAAQGNQLSVSSYACKCLLGSQYFVLLCECLKQRKQNCISEHVEQMCATSATLYGTLLVACPSA